MPMWKHAKVTDTELMRLDKMTAGVSIASRTTESSGKQATLASFTNPTSLALSTRTTGFIRNFWKRLNNPKFERGTFFRLNC